MIFLLNNELSSIAFVQQEEWTRIWYNPKRCLSNECHVLLPALISYLSWPCMITMINLVARRVDGDFEGIVTKVRLRVVVTVARRPARPTVSIAHKRGFSECQRRHATTSNNKTHKQQTTTSAPRSINLIEKQSNGRSSRSKSRPVRGIRGKT